MSVLAKLAPLYLDDVVKWLYVNLVSSEWSIVQTLLQ